MNPEHVWTFYDFALRSQAKIEEKIRHLHANPVKGGPYGLPNNGAGAVRGTPFWQRPGQCGSISSRQWS